MVAGPVSTGRTERYIAFLRAINVGGHNVKMDLLRSLFEALGFTGVTTFIASGNVIFDGTDQSDRALEEQVERQLRRALGYDVATFIRTASEIAVVADYRPFAIEDLEAEGSTLHVAFLHAPLAEEARQALLALRSQIDDFHIHGREVYWLCRGRMSESPIFARALFEKTIRTQATMRNINTVRKLAARAAP